MWSYWTLIIDKKQDSDSRHKCSTRQLLAKLHDKKRYPSVFLFLYLVHAMIFLRKEWTLWLTLNFKISQRQVPSTNGRERRLLCRTTSSSSEKSGQRLLSLIKQLQGKPFGLRGFGTAKQVSVSLFAFCRYTILISVSCFFITVLDHETVSKKSTNIELIGIQWNEFIAP